MIKRLPSQGSTQTLCTLLAEAHERDRFVGGLFNAYEKAVHYELLSALYRYGIWDTETEKNIPDRNREKCDMVVPMDDGTSLWLEAKIIWFAYGQPHYYYSLPKYLRSPQTDWLRLAHLPQRKDHRAVLVVLAWDDANGAHTDAVSWRNRKQTWMSANGAPKAHIAKLKSFAFDHPSARNGTQHFDGEIVMWSSAT